MKGTFVLKTVTALIASLAVMTAAGCRAQGEDGTVPGGAAATRGDFMQDWEEPVTLPEGVAQYGLYAPGYANGRAVIAGSEGGTADAWYSDNFTDWTCLSIQAETASAVYRLLYAGGRWIMSVSRGSQGIRVKTSTDGITWRADSDSLGLGEVYSLSFGDGQYVLSKWETGVYTSSDGAAWQNKVSGNYGPVAYGNGKWVGYNEGEFKYSTNLTDWSDAALEDGTEFGTPVSVVYGYGDKSGRWLASDGNGRLIKSVDGTAWTQVVNTPFSGKTRLDYNGVRFAGVDAQGTVAWSIDGLAWTKGTNPFGPGVSLDFVTHGDNKEEVGGSRWLIAHDDGSDGSMIAYIDEE